MRFIFFLAIMICLPGMAQADFIMSPSAIPTAGTIASHTIFVRPRITPKIVQVPVPDTAVIDTINGTASTGGTNHLEDRLNFGDAPVYPGTVTRRVYAPRNPDYWGDDPRGRSELWEDSAGTATWPEIAAAFPELPGRFEAAARKWGDDQARAIASPYSENEQKTWPYQRAEAVAWEADPAAATPYCDGLAAARSISREIFLAKVLENTRLFEAASQAIFGMQQHLIDLIHYSGSLADILAGFAAAGILEVQ